MKKVLLLGSGLVARPMVRYLLDHGMGLTVATPDPERAAEMIAGHPAGRAVHWSVDESPATAALLDEADLAVSLIPPWLHPVVAKACIAAKVPLVTTSYVSPEMRALDAAARDAGILLLNECGVDPGVDHMSAKRMIDRVHAAHGRVVGFWSSAGALPAPEANTNPWGYKFGWSPRGVLVSSRADAAWLEGGEVRTLPGERLFDAPEHRTIDALGELEVYPNRDAVPYRELYGLSHVRDLERGTFRHPGWCETFAFARRSGLLDLEELGGLGAVTRREFFEPRLQDAPAAVRERFAWAGAFEDEPLGVERAAPLDVLGALLAPALVYAPGERDMIVMLHEFEVETASGELQRWRSRLIDYGVPGGDSAVARTVSLPAAVAARLILEGRVARDGVAIPVTADLYGPILDELEGFGIAVREERA